MVVFTCNACGDSLKKNQVEKHYMTKCRRCEVLSCVDCGKDFCVLKSRLKSVNLSLRPVLPFSSSKQTGGEEYKSHTKCISEEEKYSGKNYVPKPNANKGEAKQEQWLQQVQIAIDKSNSNPRLKSLLERMKDYPNIPRKRAKFENFVRNSLNTRENNLVNEAWELLLANTSQNKIQENGSTGTTTCKDKKENGGGNSEESLDVNDNESAISVEKKLNKREKKELRQQKTKQKKEKKEKKTEVETIVENGSQTKHKKSKHSESVTDETDDDESENVRKSKKQKKRNVQENGDEQSKRRKVDIENDDIDEEEVEEEDVKPVKVKFDWVDCITKLLLSKGEMPVKKLKRKVLAEYASQGGKAKSEEKLQAKFNKKISKNPLFVLHKERVKLRDRKLEK